MAIARMASLPGTTQFKLTGGAGTLYQPQDLAVPVQFLYFGWAPIISNTIPITGDAAEPEFLWYLPAVDPAFSDSGQTAYFYRRAIITFPPLTVLTTFVCQVSVVADNAFLGRISLIPTLLGTPIAGETVTQDIPDGPLVLGESAIETFPYNWQKVYNGIFEVNSLTADALVVELELEVMNYAAVAPGDANPVGFEFNVEVAGLPITATLANSNNGNPIAPLP